MEPASPPRTLLDRLWQRHVVAETPDGSTLLYIDRHLVYEVTSPQAFEAIRLSGRKPPERKHRLLNGLDDVVLTLQQADRIREYERTRRAHEPWLSN